VIKYCVITLHILISGWPIWIFLMADAESMVADIEPIYMIQYVIKITCITMATLKFRFI